MSNADNLNTVAQAAVNFYTRAGNVAAAQQAQQQMDTYRSNQFDMQRQLIYQHAIQTYQQGGIQPVLAQFNQFYAAGSPASVEAGPNGTQQIVRRDSKGNMVGRPMPLSSDADFASDIYSMIFPDKVAQARMAMQAKLAEINATPKAVPNGGSIYVNGQYTPGAPAKQFAPQQPREVKPGDTPQGQLNTMVNDLSKNADTKLSPDQLATAQDQSQRIYANNPNTPLHTAARFGVDIAMHPERIAPAVNQKSGTIDSAYTDPQTGAQITMRTGVGTPTNLPQGMTPDMAKQQTDQMLQKMEAQSPGSTKLFINAAADPKQLPSLQQYVQQQVTQALQKQPTFGGLSPAQKQAAIDQGMQTEMSSVQNKLA
ncbi:MAG: hypothetical protein JSR49_09775, partial [Proteobacteria bacterium]|nr:hypothetical protein [Pseudomonadota bacterium]